MILYINACVREESRTDRIARQLLARLGDYTEINLEKENPLPLNRSTLKKRTALIESGDFNNPMFRYAHQFAAADTIVISAPYWDLSFPAILKIYIENIMVSGITFRYSEQGIPIGMCRAEKLYYVSTAGGPFSSDFGYDYIRSLAVDMLGIRKTELFKADMLDIIGNDENSIIQNIANVINKSI